VKNSQKVKIVAILAGFMAAEQYCEIWWTVTTPSGNREIYHGLASYLLLFAGPAGPSSVPLQRASLAGKRGYRPTRKEF
jgi:hypothetical protein